MRILKAIGALFGRAWAAVVDFFSTSKKSDAVEEAEEGKPTLKTDVGSCLIGIGLLGLGISMLAIPMIKSFVILGVVCLAGLMSLFAMMFCVVAGLEILYPTA